MSYFYPLLFGLAASIFGFAAPTMLSMAAVRRTIEKDKTDGFVYSAGAATVVFAQALVALFFAQYLMEHPEVINLIKKAALFILSGLAVFFWLEARKTFNAQVKKKRGNSYFVGVGMSLLNQLAIPFYLAMATVAKSNEWIDSSLDNTLLFAFGAAAGAFIMFLFYVIFAEYISVKYQFIASNINYILSLFFVVLAVATAIQLFV